MALAAMVLIVSVLSAGLMLLQSSRRDRLQLEEKAEEQIAALAASMEMPLWTYDLDTLRRIGRDFARSDSAEWIRVSTPDGKLLFAFGKAAGTEDASRSRIIQHGGMPVGRVEIGLVPRQQAEAHRQFIWSSLGTLAANCLVLLVATGFLLRRFLSLPLERMRAAVMAFAEGNAHPPGRGIHYLEFQDLAEVLGAMAARITRQMDELQSAERKYRTIFENAIEGIFQSSPEGEYFSANPAMAHILGYDSPADLIGRVKDISHQLYLQPDRRDELKGLMAEGRSVSDFHAQLLCKDGRVIWCSIKAHPVFDTKGRLAVIEGSIEDITERLRGQQAIQDLNAELENRVAQRTSELAIERDRAEAANRAKSAFLASMSHELRTPLNAVLGYAQLMQRDGTLGEKHLAQLRTINRSGEHLLNLINDILEISKIEAGRVVLEPGTVGLPELMDELLAMFAERAEAKGLRFELRMGPELPRMITLDGRKLRQILINLLGNAVKFTEEGWVRLSASLAGEGQLSFEVSDSGAGIALEELEAVFRRFEQTESGRVLGSGTGLGMAISSEYARLMGGGIQVESEPGKGSLFRLRMPFQEAEAPLVISTPSPRKVTGLLPGQRPPRLLVVDDEENNREVLAALLRTLGCEVYLAASGTEGLGAYAELLPDLVWMDIRMPGMDGMEATRTIKSTEAGRNAKIIALTASAWHEEEAPIRASGCDEIVHKPYRENEIFDAMARQLNLAYEYD